jgi:hypothetical protein
MDYRKEILEKGFVVIKNLLPKELLINCKEEIINYINNNNCLENSGGITIPDFIKKKELENTSNLKNNKDILKILEQIFIDKNFRFCSHNDIGIDRVVGWHKDKLNGIYADYESIDIWSYHDGEKHEILKVLIYLQDHIENNDGLCLVPYSHLNNNYDIDGNIQIYSELGDVIIFDQRITHRGISNQVNKQRILVSFGFGKNNIFTDNFEKGTIQRQNVQNKNN